MHQCNNRIKSCRQVRGQHHGDSGNWQWQGFTEAPLIITGIIRIEWEKIT